jgi:hypothetical protein
MVGAIAFAFFWNPDNATKKLRQREGTDALPPPKLSQMRNFTRPKHATNFPC